MGENKKLNSIVVSNLRELVKFINDNELTREDLWYIDKSNNQYILLYFK